MAWPLGYTTLAPLVDGQEADAYGVSQDGSVVVGVAYDGDGNGHAVYWTSSSGPIDLGFLPSGTHSQANAANGDGSVIVGQGDGASSGAEPWYWTEGTGLVDILGGLSSGRAVGVSSDGTVIAGSITPVASADQAGRWTELGWDVLPLLTGGTTARATGISADGSTIIGTSDATDTNTHAVYWQSGAVHDLGFQLGGSYSFPYAASADGSVIVGEGDDASFNAHPFRWTGGVMTDLGLLPGGTWGYATGVSADGNTVVGIGDSTDAGPSEYQTWIWTEADGMTALPDLTGVPSFDNGGYYDGNGIAGNSSVIIGEAPIAVPLFSGYNPIAVHFNGTFYASRPDATIFTTSVTTGVISSWLFGFGNTQYFAISDSSGALGGFTFRCNLHGFSSSVVFGANDSGTNLYSASFNFSQADCATNVLISFDLGSSTVQCYVNDSAVTTTPDTTASGSVTLPGGTTLAQWGAPVNPPPVSGYQADFWFGKTPSFVDMSVSSNRRKFINADLSPVDLGSTGQNPFGTSPELYQSIRSGGVADDWKTNLGSAGGAFSDPTIDGNFGASSGTLSASGTPCDPSPIITAYVYGLIAVAANNARLRAALYW